MVVTGAFVVAVVCEVVDLNTVGIFGTDVLTGVSVVVLFFRVGTLSRTRTGPPARTCTGTLARTLDRAGYQDMDLDLGFYPVL